VTMHTVGSHKFTILNFKSKQMQHWTMVETLFIF